MNYPKSKASIKELKSLIKLMRLNAVSEVKFNGIEIKLAPQAFDGLPIKKAKEQLVEEQFGTDPIIKSEPWRNFTDEQLATWSSHNPEELNVEESEEH